MKKITKFSSYALENDKTVLIHFENIINTIREPLIILDMNIHILYVNQSFYSTFKLIPHEIIGESLYKIGYGLWNIPELKTLVENILPERVMIKDYEIEIDLAGKKTMLLNAQKIIGEQNLILIAMEDITTRKSAIDLTQNKLDEKTTILKEVHHRIKNNINSIKSSLLLEAYRVSNIEAKNILYETINRVEAMYQVYDKLLPGDGYGELSVKHYIEDLIDSILKIIPENHKITISVEVDDFILDIKKIFPLGAIVNEMISNSFKYAFNNDQKGKMDISLKRDKSLINLIIKDDGIGLPAGFDINKSNGFGLLLIKAMTKQLHGTFSISSVNGTKNMLWFEN